jgi:hypothetical protein
VQSFSSTAVATLGSLASFAIWVWSTKAATTNVTVTAHVSHAAYVGTPSFTAVGHGIGEECDLLHELSHRRCVSVPDRQRVKPAGERRIAHVAAAYCGNGDVAKQPGMFI